MIFATLAIADDINSRYYFNVSGKKVTMNTSADNMTAMAVLYGNNESDGYLKFQFSMLLNNTSDTD